MTGMVALMSALAPSSAFLVSGSALFAPASVGLAVRPHNVLAGRVAKASSAARPVHAGGRRDAC